MKYTKIIFLSTIFALAAITILGQSIKQPDPVPEFDIKSFDLKQEKLPANYFGHNPDAVFQSLRDARLVKTANESLEAFNQKVQKQKLDLVNSSYVYAFRLEDTFTDEKQSTGSLYFNAHTFWFDEKIGYVLKDEQKQLPSYVGQNVYGAQRKVTSSEKEYLQLLAANGQKFLLPGTDKTSPKIGVSITFNSETIRDIRRLQALVICKLVSPFGKLRDIDISPTFSSPRETQITAKGIV